MSERLCRRGGSGAGERRAGSFVRGAAAAAPAPASPPGAAALRGAQRFCRSLPLSSIFVVRRGARCGDSWSGCGRGARRGFTGCFAALEHPGEAAAGQREDDFPSQLATNAHVSCLLNNSAAANVVCFFLLFLSCSSSGASVVAIDNKIEQAMVRTDGA